MGRKCAVKDCLSESSRSEDQGVTFHKVPRHSNIRSKWFSICKIPDDKLNVKLVFICSRHFLRSDFSNFKGKKYMLKQGVVPSVFPWDKSKLQEIKTKEDDTEVKTKDKDKEDEPLKLESVEAMKIQKNEPEKIHSKDEKKKIEEKTVPIQKEEESKVETSCKKDRINFSINQKIEALDFNNVWYPARVMEEDYEENEVLIHFEKYSSKYDEWISMDSPRLRPLTNDKTKGKKIEQYEVGERCLASWSDARKFAATVTKVLANDMYEVLFDDGFKKTVKAQKMSKNKPHHASPLFDPVQTTKEERRERKRKFSSGFAQLFKRSRYDNDSPPTKGATPTPTPTPTPEEKTVAGASQEASDSWVPQWENGVPVGKESFIECGETKRKSYIVSDPRLPPGWSKHLSQRTSGASAGKWDTFIVSPDNKRFRSKNELKSYLEETKITKYNENQFDFSLHRVKPGRKPLGGEMKNIPQAATISQSLPAALDQSVEKIEEITIPNHLKIPVIDNAYKCPIEGCNKTFRKENLAQMHVKHYHSEYTKFLDSTPNVADLAYARTVGDSFEKSTTPAKAKKQQIPHQQQPQQQPPPLKPKPVDEQPSSSHKESEIAKLLKNKELEATPPSKSSNNSTDIKLKDLLNKSEGIPKSDEGKKNTLNAARPCTGGIKTLLPVIRTENKRKRFQETIVKGNQTVYPTQTPQQPTPPPQPAPPPPPPPPPTPPRPLLLSPPSQQQQQQQQPPNNNVIIEGGQVIKIVRMKQEEIINCTCGFTEEDGLMIQCDLCLCWQHAFCNNIERENQVPEKYICYICQNPYRQRSSMKHLHDQEWLKHGTLPTGSYHSKNEIALLKRFAKLKKTHDISGGLYELKHYLHSVNVKLKVAEEKNHPKLYLWSKPWHQDDNKGKSEEAGSESMLMMYLKGSPKEELSQVTLGPRIPQPEAAIDSDECRLNLLEHISNAQHLVDRRLDDFEKCLNDLEHQDEKEQEEQVADEEEDDEHYTRTRQTLKMLLRDLESLQFLANNTTL